MQGLMQDVPLTLDHFFRRAERLFSKKEIRTATPTGLRVRTYGEWAERSRRLGGVLDRLGVSADARIGTLAWNTADHMDLWYAVPCTGRVLHTLNVRLFPDELRYVINHAGDEVIFANRSLVGLLAPLLPSLKTVRHIVVMDDGAGEVPDLPGVEVHDHEALLAAAAPVEFGVVTDEHRAAAMCYTSGTTGNPKGVVYSHRGLWLHTLGLTGADSWALHEADVILPVVPMFHANAWGLAHAGPATGATLVLPGANLAPAAVAELIESQRVTVAAGVPTIWVGLRPALDGRDLSSLRVLLCGGAAAPKALSEAYRELVGLPLCQAWGMTETSPVSTVLRLKSTLPPMTVEEEAELRTSVGYTVPGVEFRIADPASGEEQPWDGTATGELQVRGNWVARSYYDDPRSPDSFTEDGWLRTGDVARVDAEGYIFLVDRTKDLIKSGGEWVSSIELENAIMAHPGVAEAAVVAIPHPKWTERPLAVVVVRPGETVTKEELLAFLASRVAKWWLPDDVVFVDEIPKTSVGKFSKKALRESFANHVPASA